MPMGQHRKDERVRKQAALLAGIMLLLSVISGCAGSAELQPGLTAELTLFQTRITVRGQGVTVDGTVATITRGGTYRLTGSLADGQIIVDAGKNDAVELILIGVSITASKTALQSMPKRPDRRSSLWLTARRT